jgi:hypothetical protein
MIPELQNPAIFGESWDAICMAVSVPNMWGLDSNSEISRHAAELRNWRSRLRSGTMPPEEVEIIMARLLKAYFEGIPGIIVLCCKEYEYRLVANVPPRASIACPEFFVTAGRCGF